MRRNTDLLFKLFGFMSCPPLHESVGIRGHIQNVTECIFSAAIALYKSCPSARCASVARTICI
jgi:hypothetical protein